MSRFATVRVLAFGTFMFLLAAHPMSAQEKAEWTWKDRQGKTRTRAELDRILKEHRAWVDSNHKSGTQADLNDADLTGADVTGADLSDANLRGANLSGANLSNALLYSANLARSIFEPKSLPQLREIASAKNLESMTYLDNPYASFNCVSNSKMAAFVTRNGELRTR